MADIVRIFKASVATKGDLPLSGNTQGDVRVVRATGAQYYWSPAGASGFAVDWVLVNDPEPKQEITGSGSITTAEKDALELELEYKFLSPDRYKELTYSGDQLTAVGVWTDSGKATQLWSKALTYSGDQLTQTVLTRTSDSATVTKDLVYSGDQLINVTIDFSTV